MAKQGHVKNTQNKAKHAKLMARKKNKVREEKEMHKQHLKAILKKQQDLSENKD